MEKHTDSNDSATSDEGSLKVALVTGAGSPRVGNIIALDLARRGFAVGIHYRNSRQTAETTVERIIEAGGAAKTFRADLSHESEVAELFEGLDAWQSRLDVLVNCASTWRTRTLEATRAEHLLEDFQSNTLSTFLCCQHAGQRMIRQRFGGAIINFGDAAVDRPARNYVSYLVSKGAIPTLTRALAVELASENAAVRVNCLLPGSIMAPPDATPAEQQRRRDATLVKQADVPQSVSHAVQFLIENPFLTGATLTLDGGRGIAAAVS